MSEQDPSSSDPPAYEPRSSTSAFLSSDADVVRTSTNTGDIQGIRAQILENLPLLYVFFHGMHRGFPQDLRLVTYKTYAAKGDGDAGGGVAGQVNACVIANSPSQKHANVLPVLLHGPPASTTEGALRALLDKTEIMLGQRWARASKNGLVRRTDGVYLTDMTG